MNTSACAASDQANADRAIWSYPAGAREAGGEGEANTRVTPFFRRILTAGAEIFIRELQTKIRLFLEVSYR